MSTRTSVGKLGARKVVEANFSPSSAHMPCPSTVEFSLTGPGNRRLVEVNAVRLLIRRRCRKVLASSEASNSALDEDKVIGPGAAVTAALCVAVESSADTRDALASFDVRRGCGGGGHDHGGEEGGDGCELHCGGWSSRLGELDDVVSDDYSEWD
jgi:hypothetical protein